MQNKEFINWLDSNGLLELAKSHSSSFENILKQSLGITDEDILIISDYGYDDRHIAAIMSGSYLFAAEKLGFNAKIVVQDPKARGESTEQHIIDSIKDLQDSNIIILNQSNRIGNMGKVIPSFRKYCVKHKHRFISTPSLGLLETKYYPFVISTIDIDYKELNTKARAIAELMDKGKEAHVMSKAGTDFYMNIKNKKAIQNDGVYNIPGMGGNIPAGEVYTPPFGKNKVNGKIVIDGSYSYRYGSDMITKSIMIDVKNGSAVNISGEKEAKNLENTLFWAESIAKYPWGIRRIGELGIGINPKANILGATIIDEKTLGTAHVALGSNHWFGGTIYAILHLDQVMRDVKVFIDDEELKI